MLKYFTKIVFFLCLYSATAQVQTEVVPPYNIKTISFVENEINMTPIFELGSDFKIQFDDLFGNEANYNYVIIHCDYNWIPSDIPKTEYLQGFDNQRIQTYTNSVNTLQLYSHYELSIPNQNTRLKISGNYIIQVLNEDGEIVFSRKLMIYENLSTVPTQIKRSRDISTIDYMQNVDFAIASQALTFEQPLQNVKVVLIQNGNFNTVLKNIRPQYTIGNELIYKYNKETQFWAGNEYLYFENKEIRVANNNISRIGFDNEIYKAYLYTNEARGNNLYSNYQDVNGNFVVKNFNSVNSSIEADYAWVYFSLSAPSFQINKDIYITGMFNNYILSAENKMDYDAKKGLYEKAILIKQGFTNYQYQVADAKGIIDTENAVDGNFYQTENEYTVLVYYKANNDRYQRIIGKGSANSLNITN
ncbi:DUF5103 domain-containing protein [Flavobacterium sp. TAB 87]|uniref:type IX secretion system plug protein n=1 Tax=Flavobacterium sp. TAB 87 TaxID=1729581 RepID=UPI00076C0463|nr:DUF5103 domain-containing protein [Flavobacterium sp. TAB 87]KVV14427.1 hypothetical protein AP058_02322 [Flavobacterium sp. TAB 87]